jgi:hypothetical protein
MTRPTAIAIAACCLLATPAVAQDKDLSWFIFGRTQVEKVKAEPAPKAAPQDLDVESQSKFLRQFETKPGYENGPIRALENALAIAAALAGTKDGPLKPPARFRDRYIAPPELFDKPYAGKLTIMRDQPKSTLKTVCPPDVYGLIPVACASWTQALDRCTVWLAPDEAIRARGWPTSLVLRHEIAHCNGWPPDHKGARLATDPNWATPKAAEPPGWPPSWALAARPPVAKGDEPLTSAPPNISDRIELSKPTEPGSPANAAEYNVECRVLANVPAPSTSEVRTDSVVISKWTGPTPEMMVEHTLANGRRYLRSEQYAEYRVSRNSSQIQWTGRLRKDRAVTMIGTFHLGKDSNYTEELWRDDRLLNVTVAACEEGVLSPTQAEQKSWRP